MLLLRQKKLNKMNYFQLLAEMKKINSSQITNKFSFDAIFRIISYYITPFFIFLKLSPNAITYISALFGITGSMILYIYGYDLIEISTLMFFLHILIDYCDGNTARYYKMSSFFGRFIDGLFNILVVSLFQVSMISILIYELSSLNSIVSLYISKDSIVVISLISLSLYPAQHFIYDRYSSYIRWINVEHNKNLFPSIKKLISFRIIHFMDNMHYLTLIMSIYHIDFIFINLLPVSYTHLTLPTKRIV